jgi:hypothetical protein
MGKMGEGLVGQPALPAQVYPEQAERAEEFRHPLLGFETFGSDGLLSLLVDLFITPVCLRCDAFLLPYRQEC